MAKHSIEVLSVYDAMNLNKAPLSTNPAVMVAFDDGCASLFNYAYAILNKFNFKAHIFIATDFIGKEGYLQWDQIVKLHKDGFIIGSHGHSHRNLATLGSEDICRELQISKSLLQEKLNVNIDIVSLPHGGFDKHVLEAIEETGFKAAFTSVPTYGISCENLYVFGRFAILANTSQAKFEAIVNHRLRVFVAENCFYRMKKLIKPVLKILKRGQI